MGDFHPAHSSSSSRSLMDREDVVAAAKRSLSPNKKNTNPLAVASLTSSSTLPAIVTKSPASMSEAPPSTSQPFSCPSLDETLLVHGASTPSQTPKFRLQMRQEPMHGLAVGNDESAFKNARVTPLDPPPICELVPERSSDVRFISVPELSVQACLVYSEAPYAAVANSSKDKDPMISGLQECGFIAPVSGRHEECLFVFSELGIRTAGEYRIRFDLIDRLGSQFRRLTSIYTKAFTVVADKKNFPGLSASTELIHSLVRRGLKLRIVKSQSGKGRKRKKVGGDTLEVASASGQSITPSPTSYHHPSQPKSHQSLPEAKDVHDYHRDYRQQQQPPFSPSEWQPSTARQQSHSYLNPPQQPQHASQPLSPSFHPGLSQHRHAPSYSSDPKHRADVTPSLSPSAGSKTSTDSSSGPSIASTPDEEHHFRRLPGPPLAYLTPRSQAPHPSYNESREEEAHRPFHPPRTSSHNSESGQHRPGPSYSRLDLPRPPPLDTLTRNRPTLPPLSSFGSSSPSRQNNPNR